MADQPAKADESVQADGQLVFLYSKEKGVQMGEVQGVFPPDKLVMALEIMKQTILTKFVAARIQQEMAAQQNKIAIAKAGTPFGR